MKTHSVRLVVSIGLVMLTTLAGRAGAAVPAPIAYFPFQSVNAGVTDDLSINNNDGLVTGAVIAAGPAGYGNALHFNGTSKVGVAAGLQLLTGNYSVAFWANHDNLAAIDTSSVPFSSPDLDGAPFGSGMQITFDPNADPATSRLLWDAPFPGNRLSPTITTADADNWHHYLFVHDNIHVTGYLQIYRDGALLAQGQDDPNGDLNPAFNAAYTIGNNVAGDRPWIGELDEFAIWNVALDAAQAGDLYALGVPSVPEPATWTLLAVGGLVVALTRRLRR